MWSWCFGFWAWYLWERTVAFLVFLLCFGVFLAVVGTKLIRFRYVFDMESEGDKLLWVGGLTLFIRVGALCEWLSVLVSLFVLVAGICV